MISLAKAAKRPIAKPAANAIRLMRRRLGDDGMEGNVGGSTRRKLCPDCCSSKFAATWDRKYLV